MMELILGLALLLALAAPLGLASAWFVTGGALGIARAFVPAPPMEWPHGVQEDDDFQWHWAGAPDGEPAQAAADAHDGLASLEELRPGEGPAARPVRRG